MNVQHDPASQKFFVKLDAEMAILEYQLEGDVINFYHTFVPPSGRGKGIAEQLVKAGFEFAREKKLKVIPSCPYISGAFLTRFPDYQAFVK